MTTIAARMTLTIFVSLKIRPAKNDAAMEPKLIMDSIILTDCRESPSSSATGRMNRELQLDAMPMAVAMMTQPAATITQP